jgi:hypothetical protein
MHPHTHINKHTCIVPYRSLTTAISWNRSACEHVPPKIYIKKLLEKARKALTQPKQYCRQGKSIYIHTHQHTSWHSCCYTQTQKRSGGSSVSCTTHQRSLNWDRCTWLGCTVRCNLATYPDLQAAVCVCALSQFSTLKWCLCF